MRIAASVVFAIVFAMSIRVAISVARIAQSVPVTSSSLQQLFKQFNLFGTWAIYCEQPAGPHNPHIIITASGPERVEENHDLGPDYAVNRYSVLSAERISSTRLAVKVLFQSDTVKEEEQIIFLIGKRTRRTLFNQPKDGAVRVKDGIVVARGVKTPLLKKCAP